MQRREDIFRLNREREARSSSLAESYKAGDSSALAELYAEIDGAIAFVLRPYLAAPALLPPCVEIEDLWQQAFVALADAILAWHPERSGNFIPYFFRSFPWRIDRYLRSQTPSRRTSRFQLLSVPHQLLMDRMSTAAGLDGRDWDDILACAEELEKLPARDAQVVWLHAVLGLTFAEVGKTLGIGKSAAHEAFGKAIVLLRFSMEDAGPRAVDRGAHPANNGGNNSPESVEPTCR